MRRVSLIVSVSLCVWLSIPASAQTPTDNYIRQLVELGYEDITVSRTFLGRFKILASRDGVTRELVVARNGQLLFDYFDASDKAPSAANGTVAVAVPSDGDDNGQAVAEVQDKTETDTKGDDKGSTDEVVTKQDDVDTDSDPVRDKATDADNDSSTETDRTKTNNGVRTGQTETRD